MEEVNLERGFENYEVLASKKSQAAESDRLIIRVSDMPLFGYFLQSRSLWILWHFFQSIELFPYSEINTNYFN